MSAHRPGPWSSMLLPMLLAPCRYGSGPLSGCQPVPIAANAFCYPVFSRLVILTTPLCFPPALPCHTLPPHIIPYSTQPSPICSPFPRCLGRPSKLPVFLYRLDCPVKLLPQRLREETLDRHVELLRKHHRQSRIDVVLPPPVSIIIPARSTTANAAPHLRS